MRVRRVAKLVFLDIASPWIYGVGKLVGRRQAKKELKAKRKN